MKTRVLPFGYQYCDGVAQIHEAEKAILLEMMEGYLNEESLSQIADNLNRRKIEYAPGLIGWNKSRVRRVLQDKRYIGSSALPAIVDSQTFEEVQRLFEIKGSVSKWNAEAPIYHLPAPVICPKCGKPMSRRVDSRLKVPTRWCCEQSECRILVAISDDDIVQKMRKILHHLSEHPEEIAIGEGANNIQTNAEIRRSENNLRQAIVQRNMEKDALRELIIQNAAAKYSQIPNGYYAARQMQAALGNMSEENWEEVLSQTVKEIQLGLDGTVALLLRNQQIVSEVGST